MNPILLVSLLSLPLLLTNCRETQRKVAAANEVAAATGDVNFAKTTFESLAKGDSSVATKIDWPVFTSLGKNLGAAYVALNSEAEKQQLTLSFITQFSVSFRESGGSVDGYSNWRVVSHDSQKTEVAADSAGGVLTIIVGERDRTEKVSSINFVK